MKKKLTAIFLCVALVAIAIVGASLAYFTDTIKEDALYLLDEPIGGVDPATRDYILHTIISNYNPEAAVIISTHLIADVEPVLDDVIFLDHGHVALHESCEEIRETRGQSVDALFREVFKCWEN